MSNKDNRPQGTQGQNMANAAINPTAPVTPVAVVKDTEYSLEQARAEVAGTRALVLQMAITTLKIAKAYCKCRNCARVASRFITANSRDFGTQDIPLCDGCELTPEWMATGMIRKIADENLLETIRIANQIIEKR